jgi:ribonuclease HIII
MAAVDNPITTYTCKLDNNQAKALQKYLQENNFKPETVPYARFGGSKEKLKVIFYESGKLVVQGRNTQDFVQFALEPHVLQQAKLGYETILNPDLLLPRVGVDESGKGDFFGPMCIAGVYVNPGFMDQWKRAGVRDSKTVGSDAKIAELAKAIRQTNGCLYSVVPIGNEAYNRLHTKMRSVNAVLAWGHARVIENLLSRSDLMNPPPVRAISDQFATTKDVVEKALMALGRDLELVQRHKAEEDIAVAAASILARDEFVSRLKKMEHQYGLSFPKGASAEVEKAGRAFVAKYGAASLPKVAKMHFRTSARVQGLAEPPKKKWRGKG